MNVLRLNHYFFLYVYLFGCCFFLYLIKLYGLRSSEKIDEGRQLECALQTWKNQAQRLSNLNCFKMCTTWDLKLPRIELIPADKNEGLFPCMLSFVSDLFAIPSVIGWHDQGSIVQMVGYRCLSTRCIPSSG